jgi:acetyl-CoA synthetase
LKPGSPSFPLPGYNVEVVDDNGKAVTADQVGNIIITEPWPSMLREIYQDPAQYTETYWSTFPGKYFSGDKARLDQDGYIWALGRGDDVLKVAGHRISNAEVEASAEKHPAVVAAAVVGKPDKVKGESIVVFAVPKHSTRSRSSSERIYSFFWRFSEYHMNAPAKDKCPQGNQNISDSPDYRSCALESLSRIKRIGPPRP